MHSLCSAYQHMNTLIASMNVLTAGMNAFTASMSALIAPAEPYISSDYGLCD